MAILANSYGSLANVASRVPRRTIDGIFSPATKPTNTQVETFLDEVSALLNSMMARQGFVVPITQADVKLVMQSFVCDEVAAIVEGVNGSGRFGPQSKSKLASKNRFALILDDVTVFVDMNAFGFEALGATRTTGVGEQIGFLSTNQSGDEVAPIFQRTQFGNSFENWDKE